MRPIVIALAALVAACGAPASPEQSSEAGLFNYCLDYKHCTSDANCPAGQYCYSGDCRTYPLNSRCEWYGDDYIARNASGDRESCFPYVCTGGVCPTRCNYTSECAYGFVCDYDTKWCIFASSTDAHKSYPPPLPPDPDPRNTCANGCGDRDKKSYEWCVNGGWVPVSLRCSDDLRSQIYGSWGWSCGNYLCDLVSGHCRGECGSTYDCAVGSVCDDAHHCVSY